MEWVEVVQSSVDKDGHNSSARGWIRRRVGGDTHVHLRAPEALRMEGGRLPDPHRSEPSPGSRRRWLSHDTEGQGVRGYMAKQVAEEAPEFGGLLGFAPRYPSNPRTGSRRGDPGRRAGNGGGTGAEHIFNVAHAAQRPSLVAPLVLKAAMKAPLRRRKIAASGSDSSRQWPNGKGRSPAPNARRSPRNV